MEEFQKYRELSLRHLRAADYILNYTYPVVEDPKLLLGVLENILKSLTASVYSIVSYERLFRRLPPYAENFDSQYNLFRIRIMPRYKIDKTHTAFIDKVKEIIKKHKTSPIEFKRKDKFVICSEGWKVETLGIQQLRDFIYKTQAFFDSVSEITSKHKAIFEK